MTRQVWGTSEIAELLGVTRLVVSQWRTRGRMPPPDEMLSTGPVWFAGTVEYWVDGLRRLHLARRRDQGQ